MDETTNDFECLADLTEGLGSGPGDELVHATRVIDATRVAVGMLGTTAPKVPLRRPYQAALAQAQHHLRRAAESLAEAQGYLPDKGDERA